MSYQISVYDWNLMLKGSWILYKDSEILCIENAYTSRLGRIILKTIRVDGTRKYIRCDENTYSRIKGFEVGYINFPNWAMYIGRRDIRIRKIGFTISTAWIPRYGSSVTSREIVSELYSKNKKYYKMDELIPLLHSKKVKSGALNKDICLDHYGALRFRGISIATSIPEDRYKEFTPLFKEATPLLDMIKGDLKC